MIEKITPQCAKEIMDTQDCIAIDVRNENEYDLIHIPNVVNLPLDKIEGNTILKDKDQLILVHCQTGRRAEKACILLESLGYSNIKNFGGIIQWPYEKI